MSIAEDRARIDAIDERLAALFEERLAIAARIGASKREKGLPVADAGREQAILTRLCTGRDAQTAEDLRALYAVIFARARARQDGD